MKNILSVLKISLVLSLLFAFSCTKGEPEKEDVVPTVSLELVGSEMTSVTFSVTSTDASELAYVRLNDLSQVPSANAILTAGIKLSVPEQDVEITGLTAGEVFYVAAAAVSEEGKYSEVETLRLNTYGENCSFELSVSVSTQESIIYSVVPSNESTKYYVAALEASEYAEASDDEIQEAVIVELSTAASEAGLSLPEYLENALLSGEQTNMQITGLVPDTEYLVVVYGVSVEDGYATTPIVKQTAKTLAEAPELTFTLTATDITTTTAHVTVTPSDLEATYIWLCQPASNYPGLTEEDAAEIAETYVANQGQWLDQGIGLYTGSYDIPDFDVMSDTQYYLFAFGYTPGVGITSDCELISFKTDRGFVPEDFLADIIVDATTAKRISFRVVPEPDYGHIYYGCAVFPTAEYSEQAAKDSVVKMIQDYYEIQLEFNPGYTMADAVSSVCSHGEDWFEPAGLTPDTEYTLAAVSVTNEGVPAKVITTTAKTTPELVADVSFTSTLIAVYDGNEAQEAGLFADGGVIMTDKGIAAFEFERSDNAVECYYFLANGDYSNPEEEYKTDDDLLSWITTNPYFRKVEEGTDYAFITVDFYDAYTYLGYYYTLLSVAKDSNGTWGPICRTLFLPEYAKRGDIQDLVDLINMIESGGTQCMAIQ